MLVCSLLLSPSPMFLRFIHLTMHTKILLFSFFSLVVLRFLSQGLMLSGQMLYYLNCMLVLSNLFYFSDSLLLLLGWPQTEILLPLPPKQLGIHMCATISGP